jgi:hypothetical protein
MIMDRLERMQDILIAAVEEQLVDLHKANTEELGEAIDMIKDLAEAIYYCTVTEAMENSENKRHEYKYEKPHSNSYCYEPVRDMNEEGPRHAWEGHSPMKRKMYMEAKDVDKASKTKELEEYVHELSNDIIEMMQEATTEEKQMLNKKLVLLANKV